MMETSVPERPITASLRPIRDDLMLDPDETASPASATTSPAPGQQAPTGAGPGAGSSRAEGLTWPVESAARGGGPDPLPAAWRYASRRKKEPVAWLLWLAAPLLLLWLPVGDAYLRSFVAVALKLVLWLGGASCAAVAVLAAPPVGLREQWLWGTTIGAAAIGAACLLALILWWVVDGLRMTPRLEKVNQRIRERVTHEYGADPHSVTPGF